MTAAATTRSISTSPLSPGQSAAGGTGTPPPAQSPAAATGTNLAASTPAGAAAPTTALPATAVQDLRVNAPAAGGQQAGVAGPAPSPGSPVTNTDTAVVVASFNSTPPTLTQGTIAAALSNGTSAAVTAVQAFPGQTGTFLIEIQHPTDYQGSVTVSLPGDSSVAPLTYTLVRRALRVQNTAFEGSCAVAP
eukprot:jgi/Astpho2/6852/Aster-x0743